MKTLISASASGPSSACSTPARARSSGPLTANAVNGPRCTDFFGTLRAAQTSEVSSPVAVIEKSEDDSAHSGISAPGASRTTARVSGNCSIVVGASRSWRESDVESPVASSRPRARFMHWTAAPAVPLARLSTAPTATRRPARSSTVTCRCTALEPSTDCVWGHWPSGQQVDERLVGVRRRVGGADVCLGGHPVERAAPSTVARMPRDIGTSSGVKLTFTGDAGDAAEVLDDLGGVPVRRRRRRRRWRCPSSRCRAGAAWRPCRRRWCRTRPRR